MSKLGGIILCTTLLITMAACEKDNDDAAGTTGTPDSPTETPSGSGSTAGGSTTPSQPSEPAPQPQQITMVALGNGTDNMLPGFSPVITLTMPDNGFLNVELTDSQPASGGDLTLVSPPLSSTYIAQGQLAGNTNVARAAVVTGQQVQIAYSANGFHQIQWTAVWTLD